MAERTFDCVMERCYAYGTWNEVWHVATKRGRTEDFAPIRCSKDEGITLPGPIVQGTPTCLDCLRLVMPASERA